MAAITKWDYWVSHLKTIKSRFRMTKKAGKPYIFIRETVDGKVVSQFSSGIFRPDLDEHVEACGQECLEAHKRGTWSRSTQRHVDQNLEWQELADTTLENLRARIAREGSRKNAEGHLKEIGQLTGKVTIGDLRDWALLRDPITQPSAFRNRIETISHIDKAVDLDLKPLLAELRALKPAGAAKKEQDRRTQKIKAIPEDQNLQNWLDRLEGHEQWLCAVIATYGLRPSEAWHAEGIDADGWIVIPGDGLTKTERHIAPPQPAHWLERYQLKENFKKYQQEVNERWKLRWVDRGGQRIPINNSEVTNAFYTQIRLDRIPKLWVGDEWVRPYDLRHSYAIRCETSLDEDMLATPSEEFARWLGHTLDIHKRVYLRFMTAERKDASTKGRYGKTQENPVSAGLSDEVLAKLAKLEQLEKLLSS